MPDKKITAFCADTAPTTDDLLVSVNAPGGCPVNKKITISNLFILLDTNTRTWTNKSMDGACNTFTNIPNTALTTNPLARANHTGTQLASTISDFAATVTCNAAVVLNTAKVTNATHTGCVTGCGALIIACQAVTFAKIQNVSATNRILGRDSACAGVIEEITPANLRTMINVECGSTADQTNAQIKTAYEANACTNEFSCAEQTKLTNIACCANLYTHPNHTGDVTSVADGATTIVAGIIDNANINACAAIEHSKLESIVVATDQSNTYTAGTTQIFAHSASLAGIRISEVAGNPTCQTDGDIWLNLSSNQLFARINGANVDLGAGAGGGEANTLSSLGGGTVLTAAVPKCGVDLRTVSIATTAPIAHSVTACLLTFTLNGLVNADLSGSAAITFANLQNISTARLLGRQTAASGVIEEISLDASLELVAATTLRRAAITGDITIATGSNAAVFGVGVIVNADINACAAIVQSKLVNVLDADIDAHTSTKITIVNKSQLPTVGVYENEANSWGAFIQNISSGGTWQEGGVNISPIGVHDIWVGAASLIPSTTAGSAAIAQTEIASGVDINTLNFDSGCTVERVQGEFSLPRNYNNSTVTYTIYWSSTATDTDGVTWGVEGVAISDNTVINTAYGTRIDVDDANQSAASEVLITVESAALTLGNTPVDGDLVRFLISRQTGDANDITVEDARLHGIMFHITTDAAVAA